MHFIVFVAEGVTTHGFGEEARDVRHLRGTGCRGWVEDEGCSHILFVLGLHTEEHEDQWLAVGVQSAECLPPVEMVPAAKTESVAGGQHQATTAARGSGGMVLRRRACFSCFSSADPETETHLSDHPQVGGVPARAQFGARISPLLWPGEGEAVSDVRPDQDAQTAVAVRRRLCRGVL